MIITTIGDEIGETLKEQIDILKEVNINHIEIRKIDNMYLWEYSEVQLKEFKEELEKNKIQVISIDTPIGKKSNSFNYSANKKLLEKYIKIANIFGTKYLRIFSDIGKISNIESIKNVLKEMSNITLKKGIELLIENEKDTYAESINKCNKLIDKIDNVYILFDIENAYSKGYNIINEYEENKKNIKYMHIRDYSKENKKYDYIGKGTIPIYKLIKKLKEDKYDGILSLETMLPKYNKIESKKEIFINSYKRLMNIMEE